jgi:hypothetical protein
MDGDGSIWVLMFVALATPAGTEWLLAKVLSLPSGASWLMERTGA